MTDFVWMTHPALPGQPVRVPEYGFTNYWAGEGWQLAEAPFPQAANADEFVSPREFEERFQQAQAALTAINDEALLAIDADEQSSFRQQQDLRLMATYGLASTAALAPVEDPAGFTWTTHPLVGKLFVDQYGRFHTDLDPTDHKPAAMVVYYVDNLTGNDANPGTEGSPLQKIATAAAKADVGTIMVKGNGIANPYYRGQGFNGGTQSRNLNVMAWGAGDVYITTHDVLTWTLTSGNVYQSARSNVTECLDVNAGEPGVRLTKVTSVAACEALQGSWYQNGGTLHVHAADSRNLATTNGSRLWALLNVNNFRNNGDVTSYLKDVKLFGGTSVVWTDGATSAGGKLVMDNVETGLSQQGYNNVSVNGCDAILYNCEAHRSGADGYNYHVLNGKIPRVVEVGCRAIDCGHTASDQCSSMHDGGKIIRVNGTYRNAIASTIADINAGTESWNLGCLADGAGALGGGYANWQAGVTSDTTGTPLQMWLHNCDTGNARYSVTAFGVAFGNVRNRGSRLERTLSPMSVY